MNSRVSGRTIGETFLVSRGERVRILAIDTEIDEELLDEGSSACSPSSGAAALLQLFAFVCPAGLETERGPRAESPAGTAYKAGVRRVSRRPINQSDAVSSTRISCGRRAHDRADGLWQCASEDDGGRASPERRLNEERCARCGGNPKSPEQPLLDLFRDEAKPGENPLLLHPWPRVFLEDGVLQVTPIARPTSENPATSETPAAALSATLE